MKFNIITLFPDFFSSPLQSGLLQRALQSGLLEFSFFNPRMETDDKRQSVDDRPYGGGPGMIMLLEPLARTLRKLDFGVENYRISGGANPERLLVMSPQGRPFNQKLAAELAREKTVTILCGRYEGFDARLNELFPLEEVSLGNFVLNGGETAALAVCEATARLLPGFMGHLESGAEESFSGGLLEYPHYTRPENFEGLRVPEILRSGDHSGIAAWRRNEALRATLRKRPELLDKARLNQTDIEFLRSQPRLFPGKNLYVALLHYPVLDKAKKSVAVSLTNLDVHDIARSSRSYGLGAFFAITPLMDQRQILEEVLGHWLHGPGARSNPDRKEAFSTVVVLTSLEEAVEFVEKKHGERPELWGSSASGNASISFDEAKNILYARPAILLLGTGHGLAPEILNRCDRMLPPLRGAAEYNHLSVRSAGAILLDRLLGEWG